ncbi:hypothetical protein CR513_21724, partial [Mucuna pruriens]
MVNKTLSQLLRTTSHTSFELVYYFNLLFPLDLLPLPDMDGLSKVQFMTKLHEKAHVYMVKKGEWYAKLDNKGKKGRVLEKGNVLWVHLRKERFPTLRKYKLLPRLGGWGRD